MGNTIWLTLRRWTSSTRRSREQRFLIAAEADGPPEGTNEQVEVVVTRGHDGEDPGQDTHWSTRSVASQTGLSQSSVSRV
jgi:hypothetical protein